MRLRPGMDAQQRGYSAEWQRVAKSYRVQHPYCVGCAAIGKREPATCVEVMELSERLERLERMTAQ
jgi:hypothetical protein